MLSPNPESLPSEAQAAPGKQQLRPAERRIVFFGRAPAAASARRARGGRGRRQGHHRHRFRSPAITARRGSVTGRGPHRPRSREESLEFPARRSPSPRIAPRRGSPHHPNEFSTGQSGATRPIDSPIRSASRNLDRRSAGGGGRLARTHYYHGAQSSRAFLRGCAGHATRRATRPARAYRYTHLDGWPRGGELQVIEGQCIKSLARRPGRSL